MELEGIASRQYFSLLDRDKSDNDFIQPRTKPNALLSALSIYASQRADENENWIVRCRDFPRLAIVSDQDKLSDAFASMHTKALQLLEAGEKPIFTGVGTIVFEGFRFPNKKVISLCQISIDDSWCMMTSTQLQKYAAVAAKEWLSKVGTSIVIGKRSLKVSEDSLAERIVRTVNRKRKDFLKAKAEWTTKWSLARQKRAEELREEKALHQMMEALVAEALRYVRKGGRLRVPWAHRGQQATTAETWHLMSPDQFNERAREPKQCREEKKDDAGNVTGVRTYVDNAGGGEMMAAGEQAEFMIQSFAKHAEEGNEEALRWLHRLGIKAAELFSSSLELQSDLARRVSNEWTHIPIAFNGSPLEVKEAKTTLAQLNLPPPTERDLKIEPDSRHHVFIKRVEAALNFLFDTPPICTPWTGVDEEAPSWLQTAWELAGAEHLDRSHMAEVCWQVYEAAMTSGPDAPWRQASRPRKEKEKFFKAVIARLPKISPKTP